MFFQSLIDWKHVYIDMYYKNVFSNVLNQTVKIIFKFLVSVLVARAVGPSKYGEISFFLLVFGLISNFGHFGINNSIAYTSKHSRETLNEQFCINASYLLLNISFWALVVCIMDNYNLIFIDYSHAILALGVLYILINYLINALEAYYIAQEKLYISNQYMMRGNVLGIILVVILFVFKRLSFISYIIILIIELMISCIFLYWHSGFQYHFLIKKDFLAAEFKFGNIVFWALLFATLIYRSDQIMIKMIDGTELLGIYSIAVSIAELILFIPNCFGNALIGRLLNASKEQQISVSCTTTRICFFLCSIIAVIGILFAPVVVYVYGQAYSRCVTSMRILFMGVSVVSIAKTISNFYIISGKPSIHLATVFACFCVNILLNFLLIPKMKIEGAALASSISYLLYSLIYIILFHFKEKVNLKAIFLLSLEDIRIAKLYLKNNYL